jgi:hypothetical protein
MKKLTLFYYCTCILVLFSCTQEQFPKVENITTGSKWTLQIGSSPTVVFEQLQELSKDKNFGSVAVVYRKPYTNPAEIQKFLCFYNAVTLQSNSGQISRVVFSIENDKVESIEYGGSLLSPVEYWPSDIPIEIAIKVNDTMSALSEKMLNICQFPAYTNYLIVLPDKPLNKPYDPDMAGYDEWAFEFSENLNFLRARQTQVRLYFKNEALVRIKIHCSENDLVM